ncbi:synergin gamma-like [Hetaerina americana]|uniref:synergin gamma-like n=1 Tax=Hetaerina americana TaxID=62018 RepID=UPI003A7F3DF1
MASRYPYHHQNFQSRTSNMGMPPVTMGLTTQQPHADIGNMARFPGLVPGLWNQQGPVQGWIPPQPQRAAWNDQQQKEREYLKQQQKLRAMSYSSKKSPVTADALIENLLGQKDTFVLKKNDESLAEKKIIPDGTIANGSTEIKMPGRKTQASNQTTASHHRISQPKDSTAVNSNDSDKEGMHPVVGSILPSHGFPVWASGMSGLPLPLMYDRIWEAVGCPMGTGLADTGLLFPLLLTSGLQREVLGHIWALCNRTVPGRLTRPELNVCLALIALAQNGHPFCNLSVLETVSQPPVPNLDLSTLPVPKRAVAPEVTAPVMTPPIPVFPAISRADLNAPVLSSVSPVPSSQIPQNCSKVTQEDEWDDFTEFQSASDTVLDTPVEPLSTQLTESIAKQPSSNAFTPPCTLNNKSEKPSAVDSDQQNSVISPPAPLSLPTQGNRLLSAESSPVLSSRSSSERRGIGSRLANHTLGAPKTLSQSASSKSPEPSEDDEYDDFCEFRSGPPPSDGSEGGSVRKFPEQENEIVDDLFPRCTVRPPFKTEVLRESAIRSEAPAGDIFSIPKDSKSSGSQEAPLSGLDGWANSLQFPNAPSTVPKKGSDAKIPAKTISEAKVTSPNAPVEEDRYSALRALAAEINPPQNAPAKEEEDEEEEDDDDFGDFLSARGTPAAPVSEDSFGEIARESVINKENESMDDPFKALTSAVADTQPVNSTEWSADFSAFEVEQVPNREINNNEAIAGNDDDFGDFVGGDRDEAIDSLRIEGGWLGSERRGEGSIGTGEASPDSRSINAVAIEGEGNLGGRGRTGSLPSLDLKGFSMLGVGEGEGSSGEEGEGGIAGGEGRRNYCSPVGGDKCDLEQWESSKSAGQHAYEWRRCLASCLSLLQSALLIFSSISSGEVIEEVVSTEEGEDYLSNLLEVYWVSRRIAASYQQLDRRDSQLDNLLDDIGAVWEGLMPFYEKSGIMEVEYNLDLRSPEGVRKAVDSGVNCGVCLAVVPQDGDEALSQGLVYGGHHYHTTCANLWVNCVDRLLPSLQHNPNAA